MFTNIVVLSFNDAQITDNRQRKSNTTTHVIRCCTYRRIAHNTAPRPQLFTTQQQQGQRQTKASPLPSTLHPKQQQATAQQSAVKQRLHYSSSNDSRSNIMMSGNSHMDKNSTTEAAVLAVDDMEETNPPATKQQKLVKAGLLAVLAVIVVYVVLDYTVSTYYAYSYHPSPSASCCVYVERSGCSFARRSSTQR